MGEIQQLDINHWILRLIAFVIDSITLTIITWIITIGGRLWVGPWLMFLISGVLMFAYSAFAEANWEGATLGKRLIGLKVQTIDGKKISLDKALVRNISKIYPVLPLIDWIIGIATPGDDRRQKYTDRIVGTTVVQVSEPFASFTSAKK